MQSTSLTHPIRYRWDRVHYYKLVECGVLEEAPGTELIDGQIFRLPKPTPRRSAVMTYLLNYLAPQLTDRAMVRTRSAIVIDDFNEPEPDIAIVSDERKRFAAEHPTAEDTFVLMAVSESTAEHDLTKRATLYASAGIPEYWVVDLNRDLVVVHREPTDDRYAVVQDCGADDVVAPKAFADIELAVRDILLLD